MAQHSKFESSHIGENSKPQAKIAVLVLRNDPRDGRLRRQILALEMAAYEVQILPLFFDAADENAGTGFARFKQLAAYKFRQMKIFRQLDVFKPDMILAHEPEALSVAGQYVQKRNHIPLMYDAHEFYEAQRGVTPARIAWLKRIHDQYAKSVTAMMTVSPGLVELYQNAHPALPKATLVCNAALRPEKFEYDGRLHRELGLDPKIHILLYQGGLWQERGVEDVVEASQHLPKNWVTVFMGYGPMLTRLPISEYVRTVEAKPQAELLFWTAGAALGVIPYPDNTLNHRYCLPNKLWEFPLAGVPLVARDLPDLTDVIQSWDIGIIYARDGDGRTLARKVSNLSEQDFVRMRAKCEVFAQEENWAKYRDVFLDLVKKTVN